MLTENLGEEQAGLRLGSAHE